MIRVLWERWVISGERLLLENSPRKSINLINNSMKKQGEDIASPPDIKRKFLFPQSVKEFNKIRNVSDIETLLIYLSGVHPLKPKPFMFKFQTKSDPLIGEQKIAATCHECSAYMLFTKSTYERYYRVKKANTTHKHSFQTISIFKDIINMAKSSFSHIQMGKIRKFCLDHFKISEKEMDVVEYHLQNEMKKKTLAGYIETVKRTDIVRMFPGKITLDAKTQQFKKPPKFLFMSSSQMKDLYLRYGKIIFLHRFPYLIKNTSQSEESWYVLIFSSRNHYGNIVFLGLIICRDLKSQHIATAYKVFFDKFEMKRCQTVVTEEQAIFIEGFSTFKEDSGFKGEHLWDKMLDLKEPVEGRRNSYCQLMMAETVKDFDNLLGQFRKQFRGQQAIKLQSFRKRSSKYCFSQIPETFIGLGLSASHFSDILNLISVKFPIEKDLKQFVPQFYQFLQKSKVKKNQEKPGRSDGIPYLQEFDDLIPEQALDFLQNRVLELGECNIVGQENNKIRVDKNTVTVCNRKKKFQAQPSQTFQQEPQTEQKIFTPSDVHLICDCLMRAKTGLPCVHILRVCLHYEMPFISQVDNFWFCGEGGPTAVTEIDDDGEYIGIEGQM